MSVDRSSCAKRGFIFGLLLIVILPSAAFVISYLFDYEPVGSFLFKRALRTKFPGAASSLILFGLVALLASHVPLLLGIREVSMDKLAAFRDSIMWSIEKEGRPYRLGPLVLSILFSLASIYIFVSGPVDMRIMCYGGLCISGNPWLFVVSQNALLCLAYVCNGCILFWASAYIKLRGFE